MPANDFRSIAVVDVLSETTAESAAWLWDGVLPPVTSRSSPAGGRPARPAFGAASVGPEEGCQGRQLLRHLVGGGSAPEGAEWAGDPAEAIMNGCTYSDAGRGALGGSTGVINARHPAAVTSRALPTGRGQAPAARRPELACRACNRVG
jgi:hypothetical protein